MELMKQHTKWIATAVAVVGGLALVSSAQAQAVTGDANLDNIAPGAVTAYYSAWAHSPPTTVTSGPSGLGVASLGYGSLYYAIPAGQQQTLNMADNQATLVLTVNNPVSAPSSTYWLGIPFGLSDNAATDFYGGYAGEFGFSATGTAVWNGNTVTETVPITDPLQLAAIAGGGDVINGINLELDPAVDPGGTYNVTFDSLTLTSSVPEPSMLPLVGSGAAALFAFRRRNK
jgi:hypothetical protein